jgi:uncharacterized protein YndB with AHSA1/START domain
MTDFKVNIDKIIYAPIEKVFDAWLAPELLSIFMRGLAEMAETDVEIDAREGGRFTFVMHLGDEKIPHTGKYLEIRRPDKLVFTWESQYSVADNSTVTLNFTKIDENKTSISLSHVRFIDEEARSGHEEGWRNVLAILNEGMR